MELVTCGVATVLTGRGSVPPTEFGTVREMVEDANMGAAANNVASTRKRVGFIMVLNSGYSSVLEKRLLWVVVSPFLFLTAWLYRCLHNSNAWSAQPVIEGPHFLVVKIWTVHVRAL